VTVVLEVKCRKGHRCVVLPSQIGPASFPICEECYAPMFPIEARAQRESDRVYRDGAPS
jgi:hypothetical protein